VGENALVGAVPLSQRMSPIELSSSEIQRASLAECRNRKSPELRGGVERCADSNSRDSSFGCPQRTTLYGNCLRHLIENGIDYDDRRQ